MICGYCKKEFQSKSSLNLHIKKAKYCLKIQNELGFINDNSDNSNNKQYKCFGCDKFLSYKKNLITHLEKCTTLYDLNLIKNDVLENLENEIKILENNLKKSKDKLLDQEKEIMILVKENNVLKGENNILKSDHECVQNIAKQPKNVTNKILNIIPWLDFTNKEDIKNKIKDNYKIDYIFSGQKGIAKFAVDHILKDEEGNLKYVCTDPSRQIFKYKDSSGEVRKDVEAKKLTNFLVEGGIKDKACDIMNEWWTEETGITNLDKFELLADKADSLKSIDSDNNEFKKELATMTTI